LAINHIGFYATIFNHLGAFEILLPCIQFSKNKLGFCP